MEKKGLIMKFLGIPYKGLKAVLLIVSGVLVSVAVTLVGGLGLIIGLVNTGAGKVLKKIQVQLKAKKEEKISRIEVRNLYPREVVEYSRDEKKKISDK